MKVSCIESSSYQSRGDCAAIGAATYKYYQHTGSAADLNKSPFLTEVPFFALGHRGEIYPRFRFRPGDAGSIRRIIGRYVLVGVCLGLNAAAVHVGSLLAFNNRHAC